MPIFGSASVNRIEQQEQEKIVVELSNRIVVLQEQYEIVVELTNQIVAFVVTEIVLVGGAINYDGFWSKFCI